MVKHGARGYQSAQYNYTLSTNVRQKDDVSFAALLNRIREKKITSKDVELLSSRLIENVQDKRDSFFDSINILYSKFAVDSWNFYYLSCQDIPVRTLEAHLTPNCTICKADNPVSCIGPGVKLLLQRNLYRFNLVNGSRLVIKHAYYANDNVVLPEFVTRFVVLQRTKITRPNSTNFIY